MEEQENKDQDNEDRQARFWRHRPDGFAVNEKEHVTYILEFKRVSDTGEKYVSETQKLAEIQHLLVTQDLNKLFKDTQWTLEHLSFVVGHKSVSTSVCRCRSNGSINYTARTIVRLYVSLGNRAEWRTTNLF